MTFSFEDKIRPVKKTGDSGLSFEDKIRPVKEEGGFLSKATDFLKEAATGIPKIAKSVAKIPFTQEGREEFSYSLVEGGTPSIKNVLYNYNDLFWGYGKRLLRGIGADLFSGFAEQSQKESRIKAKIANEEVRRFMQSYELTFGKENDKRSFWEKITSSDQGKAEAAKLIGTQLPTFLAMFGVGVLTKGIGISSTPAIFATSMAMNAGDAYQQGKDYLAEKGIPLDDEWEKKLSKVATMVGITTAPLDTMGMNQILTPSKYVMLKNAFTRNVVNSILDIGLDTAFEAGTEGLQELIQNAWARTYNENQDLFEGVLEATVGGGILSFGSSVLVNATARKGDNTLNKLKQDIKSSEAFNIEKAIKENPSIANEIYADANKKILTEKFAQGRIEDVAQKLDNVQKGLGEELYKVIDPTNTTEQNIINAGLEIADNASKMPIFGAGSSIVFNSAGLMGAEITARLKAGLSEKEIKEQMLEGAEIAGVELSAEKAEREIAKAKTAYEAKVGEIKEKIKETEVPAGVVMELTEEGATPEEAKAIVERIVEEIQAEPEIKTEEPKALKEAVKELQELSEKALEKTPAELEEEVAQKDEALQKDIKDIKNSIEEIKKKLEKAPERTAEKKQTKIELEKARTRQRSLEKKFNKAITEQAESVRTFFEDFVPKQITLTTPQQEFLVNRIVKRIALPQYKGQTLREIATGAIEQMKTAIATQKEGIKPEPAKKPQKPKKKEKKLAVKPTQKEGKPTQKEEPKKKEKEKALDKSKKEKKPKKKENLTGLVKQGKEVGIDIEKVPSEFLPEARQQIEFLAAEKAKLSQKDYGELVKKTISEGKARRKESITFREHKEVFPKEVGIDIEKFLVEKGISEKKSRSISEMIKRVLDNTSDTLEKDIRFIADTANPSTRLAFGKATGIKLEKTQKRARQQIRDLIKVEAPAKKWLSKAEVKKAITDLNGQKVIIDTNKRDWQKGQKIYTKNPTLEDSVWIEEDLVVNSRGGGEWSRHIDNVRDFIVDGKSMIGDKQNEKYALESENISEEIKKEWETPESQISKDDVAVKALKAREDRLRKEGFITPTKPIPKEDPLAQEARKFISGEELYQRANKELRHKFREIGIKYKSEYEKFWNKNVIPKEPIIDNLNPTGGVFVDYTPKTRAMMKLGENITTLDKTSGKSADEIITIYRGAPKTQKDIVPGDFITTNRELAKSYTGDGNVLSKKVRMSDILDDLNSPLGEEYIYRPPTPSPLAQEARKFKTAEEFVEAQPKLFHGTNKKFDVFDDSLRGSVTGAKSAEGAIWFTDNPRVAKGYSFFAAEDAPVQNILKQAEKAERIAQKSGKESDWVKYDNLVAKYEKLGASEASFARRKDAVVKEGYIKGDLYEVNAKGKTPQELSEDGSIDSWLNQQLEKARKLNKDGVKITNLDDAAGLYDVPSTHYAIFDAKNIKTKSQLTDLFNKAKGVKTVEKFEPRFKEGGKGIGSLTEAGEYIAEVKDRLKLDFDIHFVDTILAQQKQKISGLVADNTMALARDMTEFTAQHEVVELTIDNLEKIPIFVKNGITRDGIMKAQAEKMGKEWTPENDKEITDQLARDFEDYYKGKLAPKGKIRQFFETLKKLLVQLKRAIIKTNGDIIADYFDILYEGEAIDGEMVRFDNQGMVESFIEDGVLEISQYVHIAKFKTDENRDIELFKEKDKDTLFQKIKDRFNALTKTADELNSNTIAWKNDLQEQILSAEKLGEEVKADEIKADIREYLKRREELAHTRKQLSLLRKSIANAKKEGKVVSSALRDVQRKLKMRERMLKRKVFYVGIGIKKGMEQQSAITREKMRVERLRSKKIERIKTIYKKTKQATKTGKFLSIDYQKILMDIFDNYDFAKMTSRTKAKLEGARKFFAEQKGDVPEAIAKKLKRLERIASKDMTDEQIEELHDTIEHIYRLGVVKKKLLRHQGEREREETLGKVLSTTINLDSEEAKSGMRKFAEKLGFKKGDEVKRLNIQTLESFRVADMIDGYANYKGGNFKELIEPVREAVSEANEHADALINESLERIQEAGTTFKEEERTRMVYFSALAQGGKSQAEALRAKYPKYDFTTPLTKKEERALNVMRDVFKEIRPEVAATFESIKGIPFADNDNYFPFKYDKDENIFDINENPFDFQITKTSQGFTMVRLPQVGKVLDINIFDVFTREISKQLYYAKVQLPLNTTREIVNDPRYQAKSGITANKFWRNFIEDVARKGNTGGMLDRIRGYISAAILGYKLSTMLIQPLALIESMSTIMKEQGIKGVLKLHHKMAKMLFTRNAIIAAKEQSIYLRDRMGGQVEIREVRALSSGAELSEKKFTRWYGKFKENAYWGIQFFDIRTAGAVFEQLKEGYLEQGMSEADAIQRANQMMILTQASSNVADRPHILNTSTGRAFLTFQTFVTNSFNNVRHDLIVSNVKSGGYVRGGITALLSLQFILLARVMEQMFRDTFFQAMYGADDDDESWLKKVWQMFITNIPIINNFFDFDGNFGGFGGKTISNPITDQIFKAGGAIRKMGKNGITFDSVERMAAAAMSLGGVAGTSQASQLIRSQFNPLRDEMGIRDWKTDEERKSEKVEKFLKGGGKINRENAKIIAEEVYGDRYTEGDLKYKANKETDVAMTAIIRKKFGYDDKLLNAILEANNGREKKLAFIEYLENNGKGKAIDKIRSFRKPFVALGKKKSVLSGGLKKELIKIAIASPKTLPTIKKLANAENDEDRVKALREYAEKFGKGAAKTLAKRALVSYKLISRELYVSYR